MSTLRVYLGQLLARVEEAEENMDKQAQEVIKLKEQVKDMQLEKRRILYKLEDRENQNRRKNLRIVLYQKKEEKI